MTMRVIIAMWDGESPTSEQGSCVVHQLELSGHRWHQADEGGYPHRIAVEVPTLEAGRDIIVLVDDMDAVNSCWVERDGVELLDV